MTNPDPPPKTPDGWDPTRAKGSEKYLDFVKAEFERALAKSRVIDERARGNAALAAAAVAVIGLLKPASPSPLYVLMVVGAAACVLWLLFLTAEIIRNRDVQMNDDDWFGRTAQLLFFEELQYAYLLNELQQSWISLLIEQRRTNRERFKILGRQRFPLVGLFVVVTLIVLAALVTPTPPSPVVSLPIPNLPVPLVGPPLPIK